MAVITSGLIAKITFSVVGAIASRGAVKGVANVVANSIGSKGLSAIAGLGVGVVLGKAGLTLEEILQGLEWLLKSKGLGKVVQKAKYPLMPVDLEREIRVLRAVSISSTISGNIPLGRVNGFPRIEAPARPKAMAITRAESIALTRAAEIERIENQDKCKKLPDSRDEAFRKAKKIAGVSETEVAYQVQSVPYRVHGLYPFYKGLQTTEYIFFNVYTEPVMIQEHHYGHLKGYVCPHFNIRSVHESMPTRILRIYGKNNEIVIAESHFSRNGESIKPDPHLFFRPEQSVVDSVNKVKD